MQRGNNKKIKNKVDKRNSKVKSKKNNDEQKKNVKEED